MLLRFGGADDNSQAADPRSHLLHNGKDLSDHAVIFMLGKLVILC